MGSNLYLCGGMARHINRISFTAEFFLSNMIPKPTFILKPGRHVFGLLAVFSFLVLSTSVFADVCVWRDPERTMQKLFPNAQDYKTVTDKITPENISTIEKQIGAPLDPSEKKEFDFYDITGNGTTLGTVMALAGKGEYGAIEIVIGLNKQNEILGVYIQRSRERTTSALQSNTFLKQFAGKTKDNNFENITPASPDAKEASRIVAFVVKKMLVLKDVLRKEP